MSCVTLLLALVFCEPDDRFLMREYVDGSVGLFFREYAIQGREITTAYQLAGTDLRDDVVDTLSTPLLVLMNQKPYVVVCAKDRCRLQAY